MFNSREPQLGRVNEIHSKSKVNFSPLECVAGTIQSILNPFTPKSESISNQFAWSLTRIITSQSMKDLAFHSLFIRKIITVNSPLTDTLASGQLYLRTLFSIPVFTSQSRLYLRISVSGHSRKRTRTHLKMEFASFHCLRSLASGHPTYCTNCLRWRSNRSVGIGVLKPSVCVTWQSRKRFSCYFWLPDKA